MKSVIIVGENSLVMTTADMLDPKEMKLVGFGDTREKNWNVFDENGNVKEEITGLPVMPVEMVASLEPDCVIVAALDPDRNEAFKYLLYRSNYFGDVIFLYDLAEKFSVKTAAIRRLSCRLSDMGVAGSIAELGCHKGDTSWQLNALMPERKLYLFDTFSGFDERDVQKELELGCSKAQTGDQKYENVNKLLSRMVNPEQVVLKKGWFPETASVAENEKFAFVYLDACLYQPTLSGLEFFFPRMSPGGMILLPRYEDDEFNGIFQAVTDFEKTYGHLLMLPLGDLLGTMVIVHP